MDDNCRLESNAGYQELCDMLMTRGRERGLEIGYKRTKVSSAFVDIETQVNTLVDYLHWLDNIVASLFTFL